MEYIVIGLIACFVIACFAMNVMAAIIDGRRGNNKKNKDHEI